MSLELYDASVPVFVQSLESLSDWMDRARSFGLAEPRLIEARLAPDMLAFPGQIQRASDTAKNAVARLTGIPAPSMPDTETSIDELKARCRATITFLRAVDRAAFGDAEGREIVLPYPRLGTLRFTGATYLTGYALPNFFFHVVTAYGLLRGAGVPLGKADYLRHLAAQGEGDGAAAG